MSTGLWKMLRTAIVVLTVCCPAAYSYSGGTGEPNDPYQIASADDLLAMAAATADYGKCFVLTADIDLAGRTFTTAIIAPDTVPNNPTYEGTVFTGTFDGNGHKVLHLSIDGGSNSYLGLFGQIGAGSAVKNLGVENVTFGFTYARMVGGLVGMNASGGSISGCHSTGTISGGDYNSFLVGGLVGANSGSVGNCYSTCTVNGGGAVGGLAGSNGSSGTIRQCYSTGAVSSGFAGNYPDTGGLLADNSGSISQCYSTGTVTGSSVYVGGLVGNNRNAGSISNCYSTAAVGGSTPWAMGGLAGRNGETASISKCYSTGAVSGTGTKVGGLVGYVPAGSVTSSFWDKTTSGKDTSAGGTGLLTADMKTLATFAGWDFLSNGNFQLNTWRMCVDGVDYPHLTWEYVRNGDFACPDGVATDDLASLAADWLMTMRGPTGGPTPLTGADATGDSTVNFADFATLASRWMQ